MPGPNDWHRDPEDGQIKSGLGEFEPSEQARRKMTADAVAEQARREQLIRDEVAIRQQAQEMEDRRAQFQATTDAKAAELKAKEDELEAQFAEMQRIRTELEAQLAAAKAGTPPTPPAASPADPAAS